MTEKQHTTYLDCPFEEKEDAKSKGAQWDQFTSKWFVPQDLYFMIHDFNRWYPNGRVYLDCPYEEKDDAKAAGAKWDSRVKAWYITITTSKNSSSAAKFSRWLPAMTMTRPDYTSSYSSPPQKKQKTAISSISRGNAQDAATLRISDLMTVSQLQEECRLRQIKGFSNKSKDWLLEQLGVGSIWQSAKTAQSTVAAKATPAKKTKASGSVASTAKSSDMKPKAKAVSVAVTKTVAKKETDAKNPPAASKSKKVSSKTVPVAVAKKETAAKKPPPAASKSKKVSSMNYQNLPRVTSELTVSQLLHELLHRKPQATGTSNKSKTWFLSQLGEYSIWTTAPSVKLDVSKLPVVSSNMTVAQMTHELMTRYSLSGAAPIKGLSSKSKDGLLKLLGDGSIWTTNKS
jgi:hypothetical protein